MLWLSQSLWPTGARNSRDVPSANVPQGCSSLMVLKCPRSYFPGNEIGSWFGFPCGGEEGAHNPPAFSQDADLFSRDGLWCWTSPAVGFPAVGDGRIDPGGSVLGIWQKKTPEKSHELLCSISSPNRLGTSSSGRDLLDIPPTKHPLFFSLSVF